MQAHAKAPVSSLYASRRRRNVITMGLSFAATAFGLSWLLLILGVLLWEGFSGLSIADFRWSPAK